MLISWFTVIAQIINFLILVWLLKRYLYKPILSAIEERENKIAIQLQEAGIVKSEAEKERSEYLLKKESVEQQKDQLIKTAIGEANEERLQLLKEARKELEELKIKQEGYLLDEQQKIGQKIFIKTREEVLAIVRKTISDIASVNLENYIVQVFIDRLRDEQEKKFISLALQNSNGEIEIGSAFALSLDHKNEIEKIVSSLVGKQVKFQYKIKNELLGGIQLSVDGYKLDWNILSYLDSFEKNIKQGFSEKLNIK